MIDHLFTQYGHISNKELKENQQRMTATWNPGTSFELLIEQIEVGMEYAEAAQVPFSGAQCVTMAVTLIEETGMFHMELREWNAKPADDKNWMTFQTFFRQAHMMLLRQQDTAQQVGYHSANATFCMETNESITHLANQTTHINQQLQAKDTLLQNITNQLSMMQQQMEAQAKLINQMSQTNGQQRPPASTSTRNNTNNGLNARLRRMLQKPDNGYYCSTHGYICNHTSETCENPGPNHIKTATHANPQGGSTRGKAERGL
jgi:hypothetical protein